MLPNRKKWDQLSLLIGELISSDASAAKTAEKHDQIQTQLKELQNQFQKLETHTEETSNKIMVMEKLLEGIVERLDNSSQENLLKMDLKRLESYYVPLAEDVCASVHSQDTVDPGSDFGRLTRMKDCLEGLERLLADGVLKGVLRNHLVEVRRHLPPEIDTVGLVRQIRRQLREEQALNEVSEQLRRDDLSLLFSEEGRVEFRRLRGISQSNEMRVTELEGTIRDLIAETVENLYSTSTGSALDFLEKYRGRMAYELISRIDGGLRNDACFFDIDARVRELLEILDLEEIPVTPITDRFDSRLHQKRASVNDPDCRRGYVAALVVRGIRRKDNNRVVSLPMVTVGE